VVLGATDLRKGFDGLCGIVRDRLGLEVRSGHLFLFANARRGYTREAAIRPKLQKSTIYLQFALQLNRRLRGREAHFWSTI
jgi:hypothetical protein